MSKIFKLTPEKIKKMIAEEKANIEKEKQALIEGEKRKLLETLRLIKKIDQKEKKINKKTSTLKEMKKALLKRLNK